MILSVTYIVLTSHIPSQIVGSVARGGASASWHSKNLSFSHEVSWLFCAKALQIITQSYISFFPTCFSGAVLFYKIGLITLNLIILHLGLGLTVNYVRSKGSFFMAIHVYLSRKKRKLSVHTFDQSQNVVQSS